jgi:hypothetical protein
MRTGSLLVRNEDLERTNELRERDTLILLPLLESLSIVDEDDEVVFLALVVDLGVLCFSPSHDCFCNVCSVW